MKVFDRMKLGLAGKTKTWTGIKILDGRAVYPFNWDASTPRCSMLFLQFLPVRRWRNKKITIQPLEIALDILGLNYAFNSVNRGRVALSRDPRAFQAV